MAVPIGTVISFMGNTPPDDYLSCDGNVYRINDYKPLANFIHLQFGSYDYFGGDGIDTFAVPDLRGEFLRGTGVNSHAYSGNGASVGVHQQGTELALIQNYQDELIGIDVGSSGWNSVSTADYFIARTDIARKFTNINISSSVTVANMTFISRPTNTSVLYCIKYK